MIAIEQWREKKTHYTIAAAVVAAARSHRHAFSVSLLELEEREREKKHNQQIVLHCIKFSSLLYSLFHCAIDDDTQWFRWISSNNFFLFLLFLPFFFRLLLVSCVRLERRVGKTSFPNYKRFFFSDVKLSLSIWIFNTIHLHTRRFTHSILTAHIVEQPEVYESTNYEQLIFFFYFWYWNHFSWNFVYFFFIHCGGKLYLVASKRTYGIEQIIFALGSNTDFQPLDSFDIFFCWFYRYHVDFNCFINFKINIKYCSDRQFSWSKRHGNKCRQTHTNRSAKCYSIHIHACMQRVCEIEREYFVDSVRNCPNEKKQLKDIP